MSLPQTEDSAALHMYEGKMVLVTLKDNLTAPDGEEYRVVYGQFGFYYYGKDYKELPVAITIRIGDVFVDYSNVFAIVICKEKPQKQTLIKALTKSDTDREEKSDVAHIYYSE